MFRKRRQAELIRGSHDADTIRAFAALMQATGLSHLEYQVGDRCIRLVREAPRVDTISDSDLATEAGERTEATENTAPTVIRSTFVGFTHPASSDGKLLVQVGDQVAAGQVLLIVDCMKVMRKVRAPRAGRITRVYERRVDEEGKPIECVEYDEPLFDLE